MAIGGALRAAIRAGRFGAAARESRQRARALRSLNETGGVGNFQRRLPLEERGFERMSGFGYGETPRGNALVANTFTGGREVMPQGLDDYMFARPLPRGPIAAPFEDFRVIPGYSPMYTPEYIGGPMPMVPRVFRPTPPSTFPSPAMRRPAFPPSNPMYSFDDITGVSSFVDPQSGFRYTLNGFPLD